MPAIKLLLPSSCQKESEPFAERREGAYIRSWNVDCGSDGLDGQPISVEELPNTLIDVIVKIHRNGGHEIQMLLTPDQPQAVIDPSNKQTDSFHFLPMGIEHILAGLDHLALLLCMLLYIPRPIPLLKIITAFTVAHSITLFLVALKFLTLPSGPVEFMIALSIVLMSAEILNNQRATISKGWKLVFAFGLLHGLGFAGALKEIGLPEDDTVSAHPPV